MACEESQAVTSRLRREGVEAYSCDLLPTSGRHPEWHVQADALEVAKLEWDMVLAFWKRCKDFERGLKRGKPVRSVITDTYTGEEKVW